jgi:hypothetical protein
VREGMVGKLDRNSITAGSKEGLIEADMVAKRSQKSL